MPVSIGLEALHWENYRSLRGRRVGLFTNPSAVNRRLESTYALLARDLVGELAALFAPEHGLDGAAPAGESLSTVADLGTGLPVYSLYGEALRPTAAMLEGLDVIVCDVQDIGVRYYTYAWTLSYLLEAAGEAGVAVMILDRPNPLGGLGIYGPLLDPALASLVGRYRVPVCHGMTLGELMRLVNTLWNPTSAELTIMPCIGWKRRMVWEETDLPWSAPSPNLAHLSALWQYPGACLVEGTALSEGRGTTLPFEIIGAPWLAGETLASYLNRQHWASRRGAYFRAIAFRPAVGKWAGETCYGVQGYIVNPHLWRPIEVWLGALTAICMHYGEALIWPNDRQTQHFDRLIGSTVIRPALIDAAQSGAVGDWLDALHAAWRCDEASFEEMRRPYLLYP